MPNDADDEALHGLGGGDDHFGVSVFRTFTSYVTRTCLRPEKPERNRQESRIETAKAQHTIANY